MVGCQSCHFMRLIALFEGAAAYNAIECLLIALLEGAAAYSAIIR